MQVVLLSFMRPNWWSYQPFSGYFVSHFRAFAYFYWNSWIRRFGTWEYFTNSTVDQVHSIIYLHDHYSLTSYSSNYRQRSLYGFRMSTLIGWVGGDSFKCVYIVHSTFLVHSDAWNRAVYFFLQQSPLQFKVCAIFQISIDISKHHVIKLLLANDCPLCSNYWTTNGLWKRPSHVSSTWGWWTRASTVLGRRVDDHLYSSCLLSLISLTYIYRLNY